MEENGNSKLTVQVLRKSDKNWIKRFKYRFYGENKLF